jgi:hypothetical protein
MKSYQFIDNIYHTMDIYKSLIVYNDNSNINDLYDLLLLKDYPVVIINHNNYKLLDNYDHYRMYMIHQNLFNDIDMYCNSKSINILFCLDDTKLDNKIINTHLNKIFIFSNIK